MIGKPRPTTSKHDDSNMSTFTVAAASVKETPPPISNLIPLQRSTAKLAVLSAIPFTKPHVLTIYMRPSLTQPSPAIDVFLFTFGLVLRKLSVSHCIVGDEVHEVSSYMDEVTLCILPDSPPPNAPISVVLNDTASLRTALMTDIKLQADHVARRLNKNVDLIVRRLRTEQHPIYVLSSEEQFQPQRIDKYVPSQAHLADRYSVCMATMTSTAPHAIADWVDYHRMLGVDHVFIFDNGLPDGAPPALTARPDVTVISWPWQKSQSQSFMFMLLAARRRCVHVFKPDTDEYLMLGLDQDAFAHARRPLHDFLALERHRSGGLRHTQIRALFMGNSGYVERPVGHIPELYVHMRSEQALKNGKSICHADMDWRAARVHPCGKSVTRRAPAQARRTEEEVRDNYWPRSLDEPALLVHFFAQSWEDWVAKWSAGVAGVLAGINGDSMKRNINMSVPDAEYVNADSPMLFRYTFFRSVFQRVMGESASRLKECVLERMENGTVQKRIARIGNARR